MENILKKKKKRTSKNNNHVSCGKLTVSPHSHFSASRRLFYFLLKSAPVSVKQNPWCVDLRKSSPPSDAEVHLNVSPLGARARRCTAARARSLPPELAHTDGTERVRNVKRRDRSPLCPRAVKFSPARRLDYVHEAALI